MKNERENNGQTLRIYETDGMCTVFSAVVVESGCTEEGSYVVLDRTAFFPGGGGQQCDTGFIETDDGQKIDVAKVLNTDGQIRHFIEEPVSEGTKIKGSVDEKIRYARMQNHGSEHLISGLIRSLYGFENVGFHMTEGEVVIDTGGPLSDEQLRIVEERANEAVFKNVPFVISFPTPEEAKNTDYRSKLDTFDDIRLVTVEGYDVCACCAPHVASTGQLGVIKIISAVPHRGGMRLIVTAGMNAYRDYVMLHDGNAKIMELLSSPREKTAEFASSLSERVTLQKEEMGSLRRELSQVYTSIVAESLKDQDLKPGEPAVLFLNSLDPKGLRDLVNGCTKICNGLICAFTGDEENGYRYIFAQNKEAAKSVDLKAAAADFNEICSASGGGSDVMVQGTCPSGRGIIEEYFDKLRKKA